MEHTWRIQVRISEYCDTGFQFIRIFIVPVDRCKTGSSLLLFLFFFSLYMYIYIFFNNIIIVTYIIIYERKLTLVVYVEGMV